MSYEIPTPLEYKEKIIFGLDFGQLAYATLFGLIDFALFFKTPWSISVKISLMILPTILALGFMFFHFSKHAKNIYHWLRLRKIPFQKFLAIKKMDQYIHTQKRIAVIKVYPLNFSLKGEEEKDSNF